MKTKQPEQHILESMFLDVVAIIKEIRTKPKVRHTYHHNTLILHTEVRFLSRGKVLERFISLKETINDF